LKGTPTTYELESRIAEIEGGTHALLTPSGLSAITLVNMTFLKEGDDILLPDNVYGPSRDLGRWMDERFRVTARFYDPRIGGGIAGMIRSNTRLIWVEAPGSVSMEVPDVPAICKAAKVHGVRVAMDNTWSAGLAFHPFEHGVDLSIQALTKYQSGGSDVLMGAVITRDRELVRCLGAVHHLLGYGVGKDDTYLVLRSLPSLKLRFEAHDRGARRVAAWLKGRSEITRLLHPAFPDCPGHDIWLRDFTGAGGVFSVLFDRRYTDAQIDRFIDGLDYFKIGYSWGGATSLCLPYRMTDMRERWVEEGSLVRFHIGLEDPDDLIADIEKSLLASLS
jgi:cystathionine beta-lyase